ncbi:MAG: hypothetical protein KDJ88_22085 [Bauldia sp.]|nr:hypothetical protein [Bauldia sp.]
MDRTAILRRGFVLALGALGLAFAAAPGLAKPARCFTTDDGDYACDFKAIGGDGSFTISAPGKPTFTLIMDQPGVAFGSVVFEPGGDSAALPDVYRRSTEDPACWLNDTTSTKICAW